MTPSQLDRDHYPDNPLDRLDEVRRRVADLERRPAGSWARATQSSGQSIPNNTITKVEYDTEVLDEREEYDPDTDYRFTALTAGVYHVHAALMFDTTDTFTGAESVRLVLYKNGAVYSALDRKDQLDVHGATTTYVQASGGDLVFLDAGDYVEIWVLQDSGGALTLAAAASYNYVSVFRVG